MDTVPSFTGDTEAVFENNLTCEFCHKVFSVRTPDTFRYFKGKVLKYLDTSPIIIHWVHILNILPL